MNTPCSTIVESSLQIDLFMQNKAKVKIGKMNISIAVIKDYDKNNKQSTMNVIQNKAKQSQFRNRRQKTEDREDSKIRFNKGL